MACFALQSPYLILFKVNPMSEQRTVMIEDLTRLVGLDDPRFSPDGRWLAFTHSTPNVSDKSYSTHIYVVDTHTGALRQLTRGGKDSQPRWSPDGAYLAFTSARGGAPQLYLLPMREAGEARQITSHANGANSPAWSPDGTQLAYLASNNAAERAKEDSGESEAPPKDALERNYRKDRAAEDKRTYFDPLTVDSLTYRLGTAYLDDRSAQIYVVNPHQDKPTPRRLTSTRLPNGAPEWLNGQTLITVRSEAANPDEFWRDGTLVALDVATGEAQRLYNDDAYTIYSVKPAPDGRSIAFERRLKDLVDHLVELCVAYLDEQGGLMPALEVLNRSLDRNVGSYVWTKHGALMATLQDSGRMPLYTFYPQTGNHSLRHDALHILSGFDVATDGSVAFCATSVETFSEVYFLPTGEGSARPLSQFHHSYLSERDLASAHLLEYPTEEAYTVQGWYFLPPNYQAGTAYPLIVNVHGGPHIMWSPADTGMWHEFQLMAAQGYVVFFCNPRGSSGYGEAFTRSIKAAWGTKAMHDVMLGVDALIERGIADSERLFLTGGSYGGYLTAWMLAHSPRFKAGVAHRGVYNLLSFHGTSDIPSFVRAEMGVEVWENPQFLWEQSPVAHATRIQTPLLLIHQENDYRVPIEQAEQLFTLLRRTGGTTRLIRFPREGHEMTRTGEPQHRLQSLQAMMAWFEQYG